MQEYQQEARGDNHLPAGWWLKVACALYLVSVWLAMFFAWVNVEFILGGFPVMLVIGYWVVHLALRRTSWTLLCYGLSSFWCVGSLCLLIAVFNLGPPDAETLVPMLLVIYSFLVAFWCSIITSSIKQRPQTLEKSGVKIRFSMKSLLIVTTIVCLMAAVGRYVTWRGEWKVFGAVGFALLGTSGAILYWFSQRMRQYQESLSEKAKT